MPKTVLTCLFNSTVILGNTHKKARNSSAEHPERNINYAGCENDRRVGRSLLRCTADVNVKFESRKDRTLPRIPLTTHASTLYIDACTSDLIAGVIAIISCPRMSLGATIATKSPGVEPGLFVAVYSLTRLSCSRIPVRHCHCHRNHADQVARPENARTVEYLRNPSREYQVPNRNRGSWGHKLRL
jgi:hypothetical protein